VKGTGDSQALGFFNPLTMNYFNAAAWADPPGQSDAPRATVVRALDLQRRRSVFKSSDSRTVDMRRCGVRKHLQPDQLLQSNTNFSAGSFGPSYAMQPASFDSVA